MYNWLDLLTAIAIGWFLGSGAMWFYFLRTRLIRTRKEWYGDRKARGLPVPDDWDKEDE